MYHKFVYISNQRCKLRELRDVTITNNAACLILIKSLKHQ